MNEGKTSLKEDEKKYLWSKIEYKKKKKYTDSENEIFKLLTSDKSSNVSEEDFIKVLNSLEYSIKKQMKDVDKKFRNANATSVKSKIPNSWIGVKYSSLSAKDKKDKED